MIIDCHTHAFADKIAAKAVDQLVQYYHIQTTLEGTLAGLLKNASAVRADALVVLVAATKPAQVIPANNWSIGIRNLSTAQVQQLSGSDYAPRLIPFGTYHPADPDWLHQIQRLRRAGCCGIKLHPEFQSIDLADRRLDTLFEEISRDFLLLVHMGDNTKAETNLSTPAKLLSILERFPKLRVIAAHMGGYHFWEESLELLAGKNLYFDTSSTLPYIDKKLLKRLFDKHGTERILFGSDYPLCSTATALAAIDALDWLTAEQKERIMGKNSAALFGNS